MATPMKVRRPVAGATSTVTGGRDHRYDRSDCHDKW
ncbi:hypothetical protein M2167_006550 [Streptomyces sp. SPB4]|nr:hypothetical protein [Streptomyces sp. SPB4]